MKPIGEILKNAREDLDLTQVNVMNLTGINHKTLSGYENGVSEPDLATLATLLNLYKLSADEVLGIQNDGSRVMTSLNSSEMRLINNFKRLNPKQQHDLLVMLDALAADNSN